MKNSILGEVKLINNVLSAEDFVRLRVINGFAEVPIEHASRALENSQITVSAIYNGGLIGMGRMVGDYAKEYSLTGTFTNIGGVSVKGKEPFYETLGFEIIPNGIKKLIDLTNQGV